MTIRATKKEAPTLITEVSAELDRSITRRFGTLADDDRVQRATAALEANGMTVLRAASGADAKRIVLGLIPIRRFRAGAAGQVTVDDFKLGESVNVPPHVAVVNRNFMNLLELPVLFYVVCLMYFVAGRLDQTALAVAWGYVMVRAIHSLIHLTTNNVRHRLTAYAVSNVVLMALWVLFFV